MYARRQILELFYLKIQLFRRNTTVRYFCFTTFYLILHFQIRGQFAVVKRCISKETRQAVAAKFVKVKRTKSSRNGLNRELIEREAGILKTLEHEKVLKLFDVFDLGIEMCLVLEL